jgi:hypothetical protein
MNYKVLKVSDVLRDEHGDPMRNITLGDVNDKSDNRYYVSIGGLNANLIDWTRVTQVKVECFCKAYLNPTLPLPLSSSCFHRRFG